MRVALPHPSLLFYNQVLPQLSRRPSEALSAVQAGQLSRAGSLIGRLPATPGGSSVATPAASPQASPTPGPAAADGAGPAAGPAAAAAAEPAGSRMGRWVGDLRRRRQLSALLREQKTVPAGEALQSVVLQNKAPHWNEGLRCWCLNFRGRVKLASVKNFQASVGGATVRDEGETRPGRASWGKGTGRQGGGECADRWRAGQRERACRRKSSRAGCCWAGSAGPAGRSVGRCWSTRQHRIVQACRYLHRLAHYGLRPCPARPAPAISPAPTPTPTPVDCGTDLAPARAPQTHPLTHPLLPVYPQLVRADDSAERVVMQFGKAEQDAFILDFNPTGGCLRDLRVACQGMGGCTLGSPRAAHA